MNKKKVIITVAAAVVLIAGGVWIFGGQKAQNKVDFVTEAVQKGNVSNSITATGTIEPVTEVRRYRVSSIKFTSTITRW